mmetsp:Transcript_3477/g.7596  ORF Transcript_3477/g.7596 Transcript_3477/m.7596 type:complete len:231 (+) Transcript_3477:180-872(+)
MSSFQRSPKDVSRKVKNVVSAADHGAIHEHYSFLPPEVNAKRKRNEKKSNTGSWEERMVVKYHEHLFKEFALADLSVPGKIGLRWRTREEVVNGRGEKTCGNKRCTNNSNNVDELVTLEVPFSYQEHGERKKELVKLNVCVKCKPLLSQSTTTQSSATNKSSSEREIKQDKGSDSILLETVSRKRRKRKDLKRSRKKRRERNRTLPSYPQSAHMQSEVKIYNEHSNSSTI